MHQWCCPLKQMGADWGGGHLPLYEILRFTPKLGCMQIFTHSTQLQHHSGADSPSLTAMLENSTPMEKRKILGSLSTMSVGENLAHTKYRHMKTRNGTHGVKKVEMLTL